MARIWDAEMFVVLAGTGSISATARRLGRSQPTISRQLAALEKRLAARLVERTTRQLRLTAAGRAYLERCKAALDHLRDAEELVAESSGGLRGVVRISAPPTYARVRIVPLLPTVLARLPEVRLEIVLTGERSNVVGDSFDVAVRLGESPDSTLTRRLLSRERFVVCASPAYLARHGVPARVTDLASRGCLVTETFGLRSRWTFRESGRRQVVDVAALLVSDDLALLHEAARVGIGPTLLPEYLVADDIAAGALVRLFPRKRLPGFRAYAVLPSARYVPRRVRVLVDHLARDRPS